MPNRSVCDSVRSLGIYPEWSRRVILEDAARSLPSGADNFQSSGLEPAKVFWVSRSQGSPDPERNGGDHTIDEGASATTTMVEEPRCHDGVLVNKWRPLFEYASSKIDIGRFNGPAQKLCPRNGTYPDLLFALNQLRNLRSSAELRTSARIRKLVSRWITTCRICGATPQPDALFERRESTPVLCLTSDGGTFAAGLALEEDRALLRLPCLQPSERRASMPLTSKLPNVAPYLQAPVSYRHRVCRST